MSPALERELSEKNTNYTKDNTCKGGKYLLLINNRRRE